MTSSPLRSTGTKGGLWKVDRERQPRWSDMEYQIRNWLYYTWLSGDHICEQHVHNLDVMNWAIERSPGSPAWPWVADRSGPRPIWGNIFDHFAVEYEYPGEHQDLQPVPANRWLREQRLRDHRRNQGLLHPLAR